MLMDFVSKEGSDISLRMSSFIYGLEILTKGTKISLVNSCHFLALHWMTNSQHCFKD